MEVLADGTVLGKGTVKIRVRPRALRVVALKVGAAIEAPGKDAARELPAPVSPAMTASQGA